MRLRQIEITNFLSIGSITYSFEDQGLVLVEGDNQDVESSKSNGAGKSTAFCDALCWCLFGQTTKGQAADQVLRDGKEKGCRVVVALEVGGQEFRISRHRKHPTGKNSVHVEVESHIDDCALGLGHCCDCGGTWKDISKSTNPATDKLIQSILHVDKQTFLYTTVLGQGLTFRFSQLTDQDRKTVLESITDLDMYEKARKLARKRVREINVRIEGMTGQLKEINISIGENQDQLQRVKDEQQAAAERKETKRKEITESIALQVRYAEELKAERETLVDPSSFDSKIELFESAREKARAAHDQLRGDYARATAERSIARSGVEKMQELRGGTCPTCGAELTGEHLKTEAHRRAQEMATADAAVLRLRAPMEEAQERSRAAEATYLDWKEKKLAASRAIDALDPQIVQTENEVKALRRSLVELDGDDPYSANIQRIEDLLNKIMDRKGDLVLEIGEKEVEAKELDFWVTGFQEIRVRVIERMLGYLNERLKNYCEVLTDGETGVTLFHNDRGQIDLKVTTRGGSYTSASGGERDRIDIAIAFALHDLATQQTDFRSNVLICDEIAVFVDEAGIERLMQLIAEKLNRVETCFLVSQNPIFKGFAHTSWTVVKEDGLSRLEIA